MEDKNTNSNEVTMGIVETKKVKPSKKVATKLPANIEEKKLTYEEQTQAINTLQQEIIRYRQALNQMYKADLYKTLDYLFKVLENSVYFDEEFITQSAAHIKEFLTPNAEENLKEEAE